MASANKERYLVVRVSVVEKDDTDYGPASYVMGETIDIADTVELDAAEVRALEADRYRYRADHYRCLRVVGAKAVKEIIQKAVAEARAEAKRQAALEAGKKAAAAKRAATLAQRKIENARQVLAEAASGKVNS